MFFDVQIFASDSFLELTEYTREEILGRNCRYEFSILKNCLVLEFSSLLFMTVELIFLFFILYRAFSQVINCPGIFIRFILKMSFPLVSHTYGLQVVVIHLSIYEKNWCRRMIQIHESCGRSKFNLEAMKHKNILGNLWP